MTTQQAAAIIEENAMYLAMFDDAEGQEDMKAALVAQVVEAKRVLAAVGVFAI